MSETNTDFDIYWEGQIELLLETFPNIALIAPNDLNDLLIVVSKSNISIEVIKAVQERLLNHLVVGNILGIRPVQGADSTQNSTESIIYNVKVEGHRRAVLFVGNDFWACFRALGTTTTDETLRTIFPENIGGQMCRGTTADNFRTNYSNSSINTVIGRVVAYIFEEVSGIKLDNRFPNTVGRLCILEEVLRREHQTSSRTNH